jgi:hypothetical protein
MGRPLALAASELANLWSIASLSIAAHSRR